MELDATQPFGGNVSPFTDQSMPVNTPVEGGNRTDKPRSLPRLKKTRFKFLSSSVAFARTSEGEKSFPVSLRNKHRIGVLRPRIMDDYSGSPSLIHHRVLSENDREDIYSEVYTRRFLGKTLRDWRDSKYLPPIVLVKPTNHKLVSTAFKSALGRTIPVTPGFKPQTNPTWIPTKFRDADPSVSSGLLNINRVVFSEKPKQIPVFSEQVEAVIAAEEGTDQLKETSVGEKPRLNCEKREGTSKCGGGHSSLLGDTDNGVKSTRVRFTTNDSVFIFAKMEM